MTDHQPPARRKRIGYCIATRGYTPAEHERRRSIMAQWLPDDVEVEVVVVDGGPEFLDRRADFGKAVDAAEALLSAIDPARYDVLISAGAIDPGLARFRSHSPVPVVGPGEASMYVASLMGLPLSIVTVDEHAVAVAHEMIDALQVKPQVVSVRAIDMPVRQIVGDLDAARASLLRECTAASHEDGARVVYLGAITLGSLGVDDAIRRDAGLRVLNPIQVALATAIQCIRA